MRVHGAIWCRGTPPLRWPRGGGEVAPFTCFLRVSVKWLTELRSPPLRGFLVGSLEPALSCYYPLSCPFSSLMVSFPQDWNKDALEPQGLRQ